MRFPEKRQHDAMQCGAACLAMICEYWSGRVFSVNEMERHCGASRRGVSMLALSRGARELGFEAKGYRLSVNALRLLPMPLVLHWNSNHFVVLYKIDRRGRFHISDPGVGKIRYTPEEFKDRWESIHSGEVPEGIAMTMIPGQEFTDDPEFHKRPKSGSLAVLRKYVKGFGIHFLKLTAALAIGSGLQLVMPFLTQAIVDKGIAGRDIRLIWLLLAGGLMLAVGRTLTDFLRRRILLDISVKVNISLLMDFFVKLMKLPMSFFDTRLTGDIMQRMNDHGRVQQFLTSQSLGLMFSIISFIIYGCVLAVYDWTIFLIFITGSVIYGGWITLFLQRRKKLDYEMFDYQALNQSRTLQMVTCIQEIKLQGCERRRREEWKSDQLKLLDIQTRSLQMQQTQEAGSLFINEMKNILITAMAATSVISGELTLGGMLAIQYIVGQLNSPVAQMIGFINTLQDVRVSMERINEVHDEKDEESCHGALESYGGPRKSIRFENVSFRYGRHSLRKALEDVDIEIPEGKVTALVGPSGSGKTTLIKLMLGYYRVTDGTIKIAGEDIAGYDMRWWRDRCGTVMQDGVVFTESIARNIAVADDDYDMDKVREAARTANIDDFVMSLPLGYDTVIGKEGIGISQGQKQRILIARAVYKNPDFIFLDEATNSLDAKNEREIVGRLDEFYKGRTVVVAAHRLSTVANADNIIVLDHGRVVESGTHDELVNRQGIYYNLVRNQLELGL